MPSFLAIYHGTTIGSAQLIAVTSDKRLVALVADSIRASAFSNDKDDPVASAATEGRREALRLISNANPKQG